MLPVVSLNVRCNRKKLLLKGPKVSKMFDVVSDYRYIFVSRNYVFYRIEDKYIRIINLYHEKQDFMWQLFGIDTTPQDMMDYWDE